MSVHKIRTLDELYYEAIQTDSKYAWEQYNKRAAAKKRREQNAKEAEEWLREWHDANRVYKERSRIQSSEIH